MKPRILFLLQHISTGGMPQYALRLIEGLSQKNSFELYLIEYCTMDDTLSFTVQRDKILSLIPSDHFFSLKEDRDNKLFRVIDSIAPHIIHLQEVPERWLDDTVAQRLYSSNRPYIIVETSHDSRYDPAHKKYLPNGFAFISDFFEGPYSKLKIPYVIAEYPIDYHVRPERNSSLEILGMDPSYHHVLNVGLFMPGKNQSYAFEIARSLKNSNIHFHFVGNMADNFRFYWEPLMKIKPDNCFVHGERADVANFYSCMDSFLFTSLWEGNPLVIKEAIGWGMPVMMFNLPSYNNRYNDYRHVHFLTGDLNKDGQTLLGILSC